MPRKVHTHMRLRKALIGACAAVALFSLAGCQAVPSAQDGAAEATAGSQTASGSAYTTLVESFRDTDLGCGWEPVDQMDLQYAQCFTIDTYEGGYQLACLADGQRYLMVPEGAEPPEGLADDIMVIQKPVGDVYLVASDSLCLFEALGSLDRISVSGIERDDWHSAAMREAMDSGGIVYGGKYRSPDYELLVSRGVRLAVESTMVNHVPDVREKLIELGIPVLVELSSYESEPLARAEWVRLYGALLDEDELATAAFQEQVDQVGSVDPEPTGKTVAFFYLNSAGAAVVRRPGDYVTRMIEQAGGTYAFDDLPTAKAGSSSMTLQMEQFYATAKDADVIVYNGAIDDGVETLDDLLARNELLADCKAVREGEVWVTDQDMYQRMLESGAIIADLAQALRGAQGDLTYLRRLT